MSPSRRRDNQPRSGPQRRGRATRAYTSREAEQVSGVPFFTIDYWGRTRFLVPSVAEGKGRGKGRQRMYSYGDLIRLRIARELREQKVSLETLRSILKKLATLGDELGRVRFALIGGEVETARTLAELTALLRRPGRSSFGVLLDLRKVIGAVSENALAVEAARPVEADV